jgi:hypothetical protein
MLIANSSLVISHNFIHKWIQTLVNKGFKVFVNKKKHINIFFFKRKKMGKKYLKEIEKKKNMLKK